MPRADPDAADVREIRGLARDTLIEAGRRAASLALGLDAQRAYDRATELAEDDATRAWLLEQAGRAARLAADPRAAGERLDAAIELYEAAGNKPAVAGATAVLADVLLSIDRLDDAVALLERALADLVEPDAWRAAALHELGRMYFLRDDIDEALAATQEALVIAEPLQDWERIAGALVTRGTTLTLQSRFEEGKALLERGLDLGIEHDLQHVVIRAHNNLAVTLLGADRAHDALEHYDRGHAAARARGDRPWEAQLAAGKCAVLFILGRWDEFAEICDPLLSQFSEDVSHAELFALYALVAAARGDLDAVNALDTPAGSAQSAEMQVRMVALLGQGALASANGRTAEAFELLREVVRGGDPETRRNAYVAAAEAAWELEDVAALEELVELVEQLAPAQATPLMQGEAARFAGLVAARRGDVAVAEEHLDAASVLMRELGYLYELAKVLLARGELLLETDRAGESFPLIDEARTILAGLGAKPLLARAEQALAGRPASAA